MKELWVCVYRDTIEEHEESNNLAYILVKEDFVKQYVKDCQSEFFKDVGEFLDEYTADDTEDFYEYAMKNNAVIKWEIG